MGKGRGGGRKERGGKRGRGRERECVVWGEMKWGKRSGGGCGGWGWGLCLVSFQPFLPPQTLQQQPGLQSAIISTNYPGTYCEAQEGKKKSKTPPSYPPPSEGSSPPHSQMGKKKSREVELQPPRLKNDLARKQQEPPLHRRESSSRAGSATVGEARLPCAWLGFGLTLLFSRKAGLWDCCCCRRRRRRMPRRPPLGAVQFPLVLKSRPSLTTGCRTNGAAKILQSLRFLSVHFLPYRSLSLALSLTVVYSRLPLLSLSFSSYPSFFLPSSELHTYSLIHAHKAGVAKRFCSFQPGALRKI